MDTRIFVTESASSLRTLARETLRGNWKLGFLATFIYMAVISIPPAILIGLFGEAVGTSVGGIYSLLVCGPFVYGYSLFCLNLFRARETKLEQVFYGFENFGKALGLMFLSGLFIFLWSLLFFIPGVIAAYRYSQAFFILVDNPQMGILECLAASKEIMRGNKFKLFCLQFSFIGWAILASIPQMLFGFVLDAMPSGLAYELFVLILSIPLLFVQLYMSIAEVGFYEILTGHLRPGVIETTAEVNE